MATPSTRTVLAVLTKERLLDLGRTFSIALPRDQTKEGRVEAIVAAMTIEFRNLVDMLGRDELKAACRTHGLDDTGRARQALVARLLQAHGAADSLPPKPVFVSRAVPRYAPRVGDIVHVRRRQWLVEDVAGPFAEGQATLIRMSCLDDDNAGRSLEVLWELELGARVVQPEVHGLGAVSHLDEPRHFAAYLHALKWNSVTATDGQLFQSPFRAGIKLMDHQLLPLEKALSLPRANLFIADDVGLGKTIEAGLVVTELLLRQRIDFILIVCPASVCMQWQAEMQRRFGLRFEIMNRAFLGRRQRERGFGVNAWSTHTRFIVSHPIVRRPEYRDPLLAHLGDRAPKSLLVLDEAHVAAPAGSGRYAVDSKITRVVRDVAPRFENRLFLSATPHNGHSNSFSALLELLDPQRFTRGVAVRDPKRLEAVMVRRLKEDLRKLGYEDFPKRTLVSHRVGTPQSAELVLAKLLADYTQLVKPRKGQGALVFINLQKRLLSSVEAFHRTLQAHATAVAEGRAKTAIPIAASEDEDELGVDDDTLDAEDEARAGAIVVTPDAQARALLDQMTELARANRNALDAKVSELIEWIKTNLQNGKRWGDRRVIIFTEYGDTKRWLRRVLDDAIGDTDRAQERILELHGGMGEDVRDAVQTAFNSKPDEHPVRILLATDAAREGVNLQGHCADLFHFDLPWNPARIEQRNGRIDRVGGASEVRCHYFIYPDRAEDPVLETLIDKIPIIKEELGSMTAVLFDRMSSALEDGIDAGAAGRLRAAHSLGALQTTTKAELESLRRLDSVKSAIERAAELLQRSSKIGEFDADGCPPALLREALDVGLQLAGAAPLEPAKGGNAFIVPPLPDSWADTLDTLRPPRGREEPFWEYRKKSPRPVVFRAPPAMNDAVEQLHLSHPFVQRVLGRFLAQGFAAHDLSRVTIVRTTHDALVRVIGFGRLSLFGNGATRLHDRVVSVAARWIEGHEDELRTFADAADRKAIDLLEQVLLESPKLSANDEVRARVIAAAPKLFARLFAEIRIEADARSRDAENQLTARGAAESAALSEILETQRASIVAEIERRENEPQLALTFDKREKDQFDDETEHMKERLVALEREAKEEPPKIQALYKVALRRLEPIGLVVLWPETRT